MLECISEHENNGTRKAGLYWNKAKILDITRQTWAVYGNGEIQLDTERALDNLAQAITGNLTDFVRLAVEVSAMAKKSSIIKASTYNEASKELVITFTDGNDYLYYDVPPKRYKEFLEAESQGMYFYKHIRDKYSYKKLTTKER